jgi:peptidoglycan hydrolase-like protein with peptidoglycan-binding domain
LIGAPCLYISVYTPFGFQEALSGLGYYKGPVDGIFGPETRTAIRHFQRDIKASATGHLTADEANRLVTTR